MCLSMGDSIEGVSNDISSYIVSALIKLDSVLIVAFGGCVHILAVLLCWNSTLSFPVVGILAEARIVDLYVLAEFYSSSI